MRVSRGSLKRYIDACVRDSLRKYKDVSEQQKNNLIIRLLELNKEFKNVNKKGVLSTYANTIDYVSDWNRKRYTNFKNYLIKAQNAWFNKMHQNIKQIGNTDGIQKDKLLDFIKKKYYDMPDDYAFHPDWFPDNAYAEHSGKIYDNPKYTNIIMRIYKILEYLKKV